MPIVVRYGPAAAAVGEAGYLAGLGDFNRWQYAMQDRANERALNAAQRQQAMQYDAARNFFDNQAQAQRQNQAMGMALLRDELGRRQDLADEARRRKWALSDRKDANRLRKEESDLEFARRKKMFSMGAEDLAARQAEDDARAMQLARKNAAWDMIGKGTHAYNTSQQAEMTRLRAEMNKWKLNRDVPDDVRLAKIADMQEMYDQIEENPDPLRPDERPKSIEERIAAQQKREVLPDGSLLITTETQQRNGGSTFKTEKFESGTEKRIQSDVANYMKAWKKGKEGLDDKGNPLPPPTPQEWAATATAAEAAFRARHAPAQVTTNTPQLPETEQGFFEQPQPAQAPAAPPPQPPTGGNPLDRVSTEEITALAQQGDPIARGELARRQSRAAPPVAPQQVPAAAPMPTPAPVAAPVGTPQPVALPTPSQVPQGVDQTLDLPQDIRQWGPSLQGKTTQALRDLYQAYEGTPPALTLIGGELARRGISLEDATKTPFDLSQVDQRTRVQVEMAVPKVMTPEQYAQLPSGTVYIGPDGKTHRKK